MTMDKYWIPPEKNCGLLQKNITSCGIRVTNFLHPHSPRDDPVKSPRWFPYGPQINPMFFLWLKHQKIVNLNLDGSLAQVVMHSCFFVVWSNSPILVDLVMPNGAFFLFIPYTTIYLQMTKIYKHDDWTTLQNGGFSSCFIPAWCDLSPHLWEIVRPLWIFRQNRSNERIFAHPPGGWWGFHQKSRTSVDFMWLNCNDSLDWT